MAKPEEPGVEDMMTLVSQVNPDCRPVLEFRIVCHLVYPIFIMLFVCLLFAENGD